MAYIQTFIHVVAVKGILKLLAYINDRIIVSIPAQFWPVMIFLASWNEAYSIGGLRCLCGCL